MDVVSWDSLVSASGLPRLEARSLLEHVTGYGRAWLIAHGGDLADHEAQASFQALVHRRVCGEPLAYLVGWRAFYRWDFQVSPAVLIPRPETELLVDCAAAKAGKGVAVIELGTGSGVVAISLGLLRPDLCITVTDIAADALALAQQNARRFSQEFRWRRGDWWAAISSDDRFDMVISNPPYLSRGDRHRFEGDLRYEPVHALVAGERGDEFLLLIAQGAQRHLRSGGWLVLEHGWNQGAPLRNFLRETGWFQVETHLDLASIPRVTCARRL